MSLYHDYERYAQSFWFGYILTRAANKGCKSEPRFNQLLNNLEYAETSYKYCLKHCYTVSSKLLDASCNAVTKTKARIEDYIDTYAEPIKPILFEFDDEIIII